MAENAGVEKIFSLIPSPEKVFFTITNGTGSYDLLDALGANAPSDGMQFPIAAYIETGTAPSVRRHPIRIVTRDDFMRLRNPDRFGCPEIVYIDRLPDNQLFIWPTPAADDTNAYKLVLDCQTYAPNVAPAGVTGQQPQGSVLTEFRQAWNRFLVLQLAHDLGSGPIYKIGEASLNRFGKGAAEARAKLLAYENQEHDDEPPIADSADFEIDYDHHHGHHGGYC